MELLLVEELKTVNCKKSDLCKKKKAIRAVNNSTLKAYSNPLFSKLKVLNTYNLSVLAFMHGYFKNNILSSFQNIFKSLAEQKSRKLSVRNVS